MIGVPAILVGSYILDWAVVLSLGVACVIMNGLTPNKRPFALDNPEISFPYTENETVPPVVLFLCNSLIPSFVIFIVCLVFVPGRTVPKGTPKNLIWRRKLWEMHIGFLGMALSLFLGWFVTNGLKNLEGRPRPDLLARCQPDLKNVAKYYVGGYRLPNTSNSTYLPGHLVSADICTNKDHEVLDDGFRSFPSGHASSAAAGLIYLSLFLASKFSVTIPYLSPSDLKDPLVSYHAFPSRTVSAAPRASDPSGSKAEGTRHDPNDDGIELIAPYPTGGANKRDVAHDRMVTAARQQAAAPPLYLLLLTLLPTFTAIFVAASRWFDFRHHSTDIVTGFLIGVVSAFFAFRYYHMPISYGGGWAWAPRSKDKAMWAGIGSYSYATEREPLAYRQPGDAESGMR
ncbi:Diacylglycerol pyrophosphate phosphatase 1 [Ceratocystis platani]|nr:Diacylglycerol pyrophosphate phosphatase 1 [Ceratocystis platani]